MPKKRARTLAGLADPSPPEPGRDQADPAGPLGVSATDPSVAAGDVSSTLSPGEEAVVRRTAGGWRVGDDELPDLTCAMVLADLLAAELPTQIQPAITAEQAPPATAPRAAAKAARAEPATERRTAAAAAGGPTMAEEARRLRTTVGQLEHALTARIRIEQAIGVLAERHRIRPRQAFEQLRAAARNRGRRVIDIASDVVASATNPLLQLPEELSRQRSPRHAATRNPRRVLHSE
jgi:ANTAR domain